MGDSKIYSVNSCLHICCCDIRLFVISATEDAWYIPWNHRRCSVHTMEDAQHSTHVTTVCRLHVEPVCCI